MARNLYIIRHGQVKNRFKGKFIGSIDADLSLTGLEQAVRLNNFLSKKSPKICFSNPIRRCLQAAEKALASLNIALIQEDLFREVAFGKWGMIIYWAIIGHPKKHMKLNQLKFSCISCVSLFLTILPGQFWPIL